MREICVATGKSIYRDEQSARDDLVNLPRTGRRKRVGKNRYHSKKKNPVRVYSCEVCSGYHTTSMPLHFYNQTTKEKSA